MKVTTTATDKLFETEEGTRQDTKQPTGHTSQGIFTRTHVHTISFNKKRVIVYNFKKSAIVSYV